MDGQDRAAAAGSPLTDWVHRPRPDAAVRFAGPGDGWDEWSYERLAEGARRVAAGLRSAGTADGDTVVIVEPTGPRFIQLYFGAMVAGAVPVPTAPPAFGQDLTGYARALAHLVGRAAPRMVVTSAALAGQLAGLVPPPVPVRVDDDVIATADPGPWPGWAPAELAMLQFTSGSTRAPRGVRVPVPALEANVAAIARWLRMRPEDPTASWLPMHHDMGLIGCLITPVVRQSDLWLLSPEQFVRSPLRYLRCFGVHGARLTAMPTFGLEHVARKVRPQDLEGMDFSAWRAVIVGAERVGTGAVERFVRLLAPYGLDPRAILPAYGLAEATLAVTGLPLDELWTSVPLDPRRVVLDGPVPLVPEAGGALVGSGRPLDGIRVAIVDRDGRELPEDHVGEIVVDGPCLTDGYHNEPPDADTGRRDGPLVTGDAGFLHDGQLFVLGRIGDSVKVRGRTLLAEDVEAALESAGLPRHRQTVLLGMRGDRPTAVVVVEQADPLRLEAAQGLVGRVTEGADLVFVRTGVGTIPRTTSGKPKRRELWRIFLTGQLTTAAAHSEDPS
ncbi:AMP-binding protein [Micromonospora aurantiaca]|uniref:AMP-binding protein n=1 Tax=Micromonospora aurantiaca (nom. illeg.) TaxID=47850 RepID=UPI00380D2B5C